MSTYLSGLSTAVGPTASNPPCVPNAPSVSGFIHLIDSGDPGSLSVEIERRWAAQLRVHRTVAEFLRTSDRRQAGCVVWKLSGRSDAAWILQRELGHDGLELPLIVVADSIDVETAVQLMENGALTVITPPVDAQKLYRRIEQAIEQSRTCRRLAATYGDVSATLSSLTDRQRRILELANEGLPNKAIASDLDVSIRTVEVDRSKVLKAFGARSLATVTRKLGEQQMLRLWHTHWRLSAPRFSAHETINGSAHGSEPRTMNAGGSASNGRVALGLPR
jgi:two-component system response regulator FixJ